MSSKIKNKRTRKKINRRKRNKKETINEKWEIKKKQTAKLLIILKK